MFYADNFAGDTLVFADVLASLSNGNAVGRNGERGEEQCQ
jgi:hypothetical protein